MCNLCGNEEERKKAKDAALALADDLKTLSMAYQNLACGIIVPHTNEAKMLGCLAREIIRRLVEAYV